MWHYEYNLKDHLGNTCVVFGGSVIEGAVDIVQTSTYYPFGMVQTQVNNNSGGSNYEQNKYLYNGKELQDDDLGGVSLDWYDYGARFYDSSLGRWHCVDPKLEKYYNWTPYNYCINNPIILIDPDGMDWVKSQKSFKYKGETYESDHYEWKDDVNKDTELEDGYSYVGTNGDDILADMGLGTHFEGSDNTFGFGFAGGGDKNVGPAGEGVPGVTSNKVDANINIEADISLDLRNPQENNIAGRTFNGVNITANVYERSTSTNPDLESSSTGFLYVYFNGKVYYQVLNKPVGNDVFPAQGKAQTIAKFLIPAQNMSSVRYLEGASIHIGRPNSGLLYNKPTEITWNFQILPTIRQGE